MPDHEASRRPRHCHSLPNDMSNLGAEISNPLLRNLKEVFRIDEGFILQLSTCLQDPGNGMTILFVDLDNYPFFSDYVTGPDFVPHLDFDLFIVCSSANRPFEAQSLNLPERVHFSFAMPSKDAADAACTIAMAKLDSILVYYGRQDDVTLLLISNDKIFEQVSRPCEQSNHI